MSHLLQLIEGIERALSGSTWQALWPRLVVAFLNYNLALLGTTMFLGALGADGDAPWAPEMRRFLALTVWPSLGALTILLVASVALGLRGRPQFIVPVSIVGLCLPFAEGYAYWWYLSDVAHGTISGPAGMALATAATTILLFGIIQAATGGLFLVYRLSVRSA